MNTMTKPTKAGEIKREWVLIDAKDQVLGRLSTKIANLLMGKSKPYFARNLDCGDFVVVVNAKDIKITGLKATSKTYFRHSGYPGGFRGETFEQLNIRKPQDIIVHAVKGMLPNNKLRDSMLTRLRVFAGAEHTFSEELKNK